MTPAVPALAVTGSNLAGTLPFSVAIATAAGVQVELPAAGSRGDLAELTRAACARSGVELADLLELRVDRGPGSYIGLRVAVTFARTLAAFGRVRLRTVDSLQLAAAAALAADPSLHGRRLCPIADGRQGRLHVAALQAPAGSGPLLPVVPPRSLPLAELGAWLQPGDVVLAAPALLAATKDLCAAARASWAAATAAHAGHLFSPQLQLEDIEVAALTPLYLMGSYVDGPADLGPADHGPGDPGPGDPGPAGR